MFYHILNYSIEGVKKMSELIIKQFARTRQTLIKTLEGVAEESVKMIPEGFNNNILWQVGHILNTGELFLFKGQRNLPANYRELFGPGSSPAIWSTDVPSLETLLAQLQEQADRIQKINVEGFAELLEKSFIGNNTVGELAAMGAFHEALHVGQIQMLKRLVETSEVKASL